MAGGWMIGVMLELAGEPRAIRHFFAVGHEDRAKAEWSAIDAALLSGELATSPVSGLEPVHVVNPLSDKAMRSLALRPGEVRALGWKWPRRWTSL
jgi:hypothetical protein